LCETNSTDKKIISTSLASFLRYIVPPNIFRKNILKIEKGNEINIDMLISKLVSMGYENVFQIQKVGHVSRRGGIVDIFSPQMKNPVRLEFFGDEIDSIRFFSVASQRSTTKKISSIEINPFREFSLEDINPNKELWSKISEKGFYEGIEQHTSLLFDKTNNLLSYFDKDDVIVVFDEFQFFSSYLKDFEDETLSLWEKARRTNSKKILPEPDKIFADKKQFSKLIKNNKCFFFSNSYQQFDEISETLESSFTSQSTVHNNLEMLSKIISKRQHDGYKIIIQSDNKSQMKRMTSLLEDFDLFVEHSIGVLQKGFNLEDGELTVLTDHEIFSRYKRRRRKSKYSQKEALADYESLKPNDYIVHIDYGIGKYYGLKKLTLGGNEVECLVIGYAENDTVFVPTYQLQLVSRFVAEEGLVPTIHKIGSKKWDNAKSRAKKQIELVADDILKLYAERNLRKGIKALPDNEWQRDLEDSFIYEDTIDQARAIEEIKEDMESDAPMERLLCGDVGFGKTEVAIRAAFKSVMSGYQVAILVPTTLLAEQHYLVFKERVAQFPVNVAMLSRFRSKANMHKDIADISLGQIDIVVGTHRLLSKDIKFKKLGLLIIDEEHRFGVRQKEKIRKLKSNVDTLYMSATPIPRTLSLALSKLKELSLIQTSPKERLPVRTIVISFEYNVIKNA
ncbi:MAG: CarD family transcriptional regulator, partial [Candidatus Cloacimonadota bacterium]|nr:CarD family transcriptional regulator [Candidatus Cloacimonadota bacterium]